ncbi:MAG: hypothetical protein Q7S35_10055 [Candidatus Limnocylindrales bacterium]|nr:hypothetical protein [Candidatus Limnocylindrales bacterium]
MSIDEQPVALPKLYGAPAYARPPAPVAAVPRPFDPDQLPLELYRTEGERRAAPYPPAHAYTPALDIAGDPRHPDDRGAAAGLRHRPFSLRAIAGRLLAAPDSGPATHRDVASRGDPMGE